MSKVNQPAGSSAQLNLSRKERIDRERVHQIFSQSFIGVTASVLIAFVLFYLLREIIESSILTGWLVAVLLVSLARLLLVIYFSWQSDAWPHAAGWGWGNMITLGLSGVVWGAASWLLFPAESIEHQFFLVLALCGMVSGATMAFAVMTRAFLTFSIPAIIPLFLRLITLPGQVHFSMGIIALFFWILSFMIASNYKKVRLNLLNLKEDLSDKVAQRTLELEKMNARLRAENRNRTRMEDRLRQERDRLETITGNLGAGLAVISKDYNILWSNQVLKNIFGDVEGRSCFETIYKDLDAATCNARKVIAQGFEKVIQEQSGRDTLGNPIWYQIITTPIRDAGGHINAALELVLPITDLKKAQEEKQRMSAHLEEARKLEAVATLAGGMAHKFNNALAVIMGNAELIRFDYDQKNSVENYLRPLMSAAAQMSQMTDQLLAYAKGGKYKAKATDVSIFVNDTMALLQHTLPMEIKVCTALEKPLPYVKMDVTQMQMVLSAIVANATEALPQGGSIQVDCKNLTIQSEDGRLYGGVAPGPYAALSIRDNGVGMDAKTLQRIFEPFFSTKFEGRGLGMAAVYGIIQNHDGHIAVASQPGQGTQVNIYLPATQAPEEKVAIARAPQKAKSTGKGTILLVEDEQMVGAVNQAMLSRLGYTVVTASTGQEALNHLRNPRFRFDLVLLDIKLPDMDGTAIYPIIRECQPDTKVIVCSGYALDGPTQSLIDAGAEGFIQKPFSMDSLAEKLSEVLSPLNL